jgi:2-C-methyl-D-erythritol 2,4-cyclodiphosphate synthase
VDASLIAEEPKISPHLSLMKERVGAALGIPPRRIGIKATTNEELGFLGRGEGMAAMATACVDRPE